MATTPRRVTAGSAADRAFARSMLRLRAGRKWSAKRLAEAAGIPSGTVVNVERGRSPVLHNAHAIAVALDTTVDAMIAEADIGAGEGR